jgi:hypothetical protein
MTSSESEVMEDESESAGVAVGAWALKRRASASDKAERYEAAVFGAKVDELFFLNIEDVGDMLLRAMGDGRGEAGILEGRLAKQIGGQFTYKHSNVMVRCRIILITWSARVC